MLVTRSIVKAYSVKFSVGVINLPQPQFPYLWSESNQDDDEESGQVRLAVRPQPLAATLSTCSLHPQVSSCQLAWNDPLPPWGSCPLFPCPGIQAEALTLNLATYISASQNAIWEPTIEKFLIFFLLMTFPGKLTFSFLPCQFSNRHTCI